MLFWQTERRDPFAEEEDLWCWTYFFFFLENIHTEVEEEEKNNNSEKKNFFLFFLVCVSCSISNFLKHKNFQQKIKI